MYLAEPVYLSDRVVHKHELL